MNVSTSYLFLLTMILQNYKYERCSTPKLNLATKIFNVDSFVVFSSIFLFYGVLTHQIFIKFYQGKMFQILLYPLSNLFDPTNLIKLI